MDKKYSDNIYKLFKSKINQTGLYTFEFNEKAPNIKYNLLKTQKNDDFFTYSVNSYGFRSKEFKEYSKDNLKILFAGCSNTFGQGLSEEYIWSKLLIKKIYNTEKNIKIEDYNISYSAASVHSIIRNIYFFIEKFGTPDYLFIMFPGVNRDLYFSDKKNNFVNCLLWNEYLSFKDSTQQKFNLNYIEENSILLSTTLIYMLESFCKASKIKLIWTTWREEDKNLFKELDFKNFFSIDTNTNNLINDKNLPYWDLAKDGYHPGIAWNIKVSEEYFNKINEK